MTAKERLKKFLSYKKVGRNKFENDLGISTGYMSSKGVSINSDVIEKTLSYFPDLNIDWLITGNGKMIKCDSEHISSVLENDIKNNDSDLLGMIREKDNKIDLLNKYIGKLETLLEINGIDYDNIRLNIKKGAV